MWSDCCILTSARTVWERLLWRGFPTGVCSLGQHHVLRQHGLWDSAAAQRHPDPAAGLQRPPESRHPLFQRPGMWNLTNCKHQIYWSVCMISEQQLVCTCRVLIFTMFVFQFMSNISSLLFSGGDNPGEPVCLRTMCFRGSERTRYKSEVIKRWISSLWYDLCDNGYEPNAFNFCTVGQKTLIPL